MVYSTTVIKGDERVNERELGGQADTTLSAEKEGLKRH